MSISATYVACFQSPLQCFTAARFQSVKFLGVTFDKKLSYKPCIANLKKYVKALNIIKVVSSTHWCNGEILLHL